MTTGSGPDHRAYQKLLIDQANAEMGRQRISRRELMRRTGIPDATMNRIFNCERDMNVTQWDAIATALGFDPGELARKATGQVVPTASDHATPPSGGDVRELMLWFVAHPEDDAALQTRLGELRSQSGASRRMLSETERQMVLNRRRELERALEALPPAQAV